MELPVRAKVGDLVELACEELRVVGFVHKVTKTYVILSHERPQDVKRLGWRTFLHDYRGSMASGHRRYNLEKFERYKLLDSEVLTTESD